MLENGILCGGKRPSQLYWQGLVPRVGPCLVNVLLFSSMHALLDSSRGPEADTWCREGNNAIQVAHMSLAREGLWKTCSRNSSLFQTSSAVHAPLSAGCFSLLAKEESGAGTRRKLAPASAAGGSPQATMAQLLRVLCWISTRKLVQINQHNTRQMVIIYYKGDNVADAFFFFLFPQPRRWRAGPVPY